MMAKKRAKVEKHRIAPLSASFMLLSIIGFFISVLWVFPRNSNYGFSFALVFVLMFIASMISMTYSDVDEVLMIEKKEKTWKEKF